MTPLRCLRFFAVRGMLYEAVKNNPATAATIRILNLYQVPFWEGTTIYLSVYPYAFHFNEA